MTAISQSNNILIVRADDWLFFRDIESIRWGMNSLSEFVLCYRYAVLCWPATRHLTPAPCLLNVFVCAMFFSTVVGGSRYGMSLYFTCQQRFSPIYEGGIQPDIPWQKRHLEYLSHTLGAREIPQHLTDRIDALHPDALPKPKKFVGVVAEERRVRKEEKKRKKGKQVKKIRETTAFVFEGDKPF